LGDNKIIFEKEVAETLGIEAAIILELYKAKEFDDSLSERDFLNK
jgi:predicted DNA-binding transcriptional regulator AlpA